MERCWSAEPSSRPSFTEVASELRGMAAALQPKPHGESPVLLLIVKSSSCFFLNAGSNGTWTILCMQMADNK